MELQRFKKILKQNGHFITKPRLRLFDVLQNHTTLTFQELVSLIPKHDQATLYRNTDLFERLGIINRLRLGWQTKIELSDAFWHHHHHLSCVMCNRVVILKDNPLLEQQIKTISQQHEFKPLDHQLEIRGLCRTCSRDKLKTSTKT